MFALDQVGNHKQSRQSPMGEFFLGGVDPKVRAIFGKWGLVPVYEPPPREFTV